MTTLSKEDANRFGIDLKKFKELDQFVERSHSGIFDDIVLHKCYQIYFVDFGILKDKTRIALGCLNAAESAYLFNYISSLSQIKTR